MTKLDKQKAFFKGYFIGKGMTEALKSFELASRYHTGTRKNGADEITHQIAIAGMIIQTYENRISQIELENLICIAFLHDIKEDYNVDVSKHNLEPYVFAVDILSKTKDISLDEYFGVISESLDTSIVKAFDRLCNLQTMVGAFSKEKIVEYIKETEQYVYPMINYARDTYYKHYMVFVSIKQQMELIIRLIKDLMNLK